MVDLEFFCGEYGELWEAMIALAVEYDVELPQRPQRWYEKEARHTRWREEADKVRAEVVRRRIFRLLILPTVNRIEKEEERREELMRAWRDFSTILLEDFCLLGERGLMARDIPREWLRPERNGRIPETVTAADLMAAELPPVRWGVRGVLPEGVTLLGRQTEAREELARPGALCGRCRRGCGARHQTGRAGRRPLPCP